MTLIFHLCEDTVSGNEFVKRTGPLTEREKQFLQSTKQTAIARIEPVDERLVRYQSYFDVSDEDFSNLRNSVHNNHTRKTVAIAANELRFPKDSSGTVYSVEFTYTNISVCRINASNGQILSKKVVGIVEAMKGVELVASDLFNVIATILRDIIPEQEINNASSCGETIKVVFATTMRLDAEGIAIETLSGGLRQKRAADSAFKNLTSDDPIVGVPIKELMNHAFLVNGLPASCVFVCDSSHLQLASTKAQNWDSDAFMSLNISSGCRASVMEFAHNHVHLIRGVSFKSCVPALPANNIDQNLNFAQCSSRTSNPLGRMITTESIAELVRMSWCHIMQEKATDVCWKTGSLSTEHVFDVVYHPDTVAKVMHDWLGVKVCDLDMKMFKAVCDAVVRRAQLILAAVIAGLAEASGRVYQAFGVGKCIIQGSNLSPYPEFLKGVGEVASKAVEGGDVELILNEEALCQGAALVANVPSSLKKVPAQSHH